jgi:ABC-type transport system involved in Fe-S cluster assembly fused permease/ATPase subunit
MKVNPELDGFYYMCSLNFFAATSAIDYETDTVIQNSLRTNLGSDVTLFTIAHRLQTIMDADKIVSHIDVVLSPASC